MLPALPADNGDRGGIILRSEDSDFGGDCVCACFDRKPGGFMVFSAVNFNDRIEAAPRKLRILGSIGPLIG